MMEIKVFQEKLEQILAQAASQDKILSGGDIRAVFGEELSASQMQSLLEYLRLQGIRLDVTQSLTGEGPLDEGTPEGGAGTEAGQGSETAGECFFEEAAERTQPAEEALSPEETAYLEEYRETLAGILPETEGERESLWQRYDSGDRAASARLTELYLPLTVEIARALHQEAYFIGDLIQEGNMCLIAALEQGKPQEVPGHDWLVEEIRQGIRRWISWQKEQKFQDESLVERVRKLEAAIRELSDEEERDYSVAELSAFLDMDEEEIRSVLSLTGDDGSDGNGKG